MERVGFVLWWSLASFPAAVCAWGLMWMTDRLYGWGAWWLGAPIRIIIVIMQFGVLLACLGTAVGLAWLSFGVFYRASQGRDTNDAIGRLSIKRYITLLVVPVAMNAVSLFVGVFHNWLNFNEHGLGLITFGYTAFVWVLQIGSLVIIGVWFVILPIFLHNRNA